MLVIAPAIQIKRMAPTPGLEDYSAQELRGREQYVAQGCVYCHSQQPRSSDTAPDAERGGGRASVASDYVYDRPHPHGPLRTGPALVNLGTPPPSRDIGRASYGA